MAVKIVIYVVSDQDIHCLLTVCSIIKIFEKKRNTIQQS